MISIDEEEEIEERFEYNKPFDCITFEPGHSSKVLPELDWDKPTILWLDYDRKLSTEVFSDLREFFTSAPTNSIVLVTFNSQHLQKKGDDDDAPDTKRIERFRERVGDVIPNDVGNGDLSGWNFSRVCSRILFREIRDEFVTSRGAKGEKIADDEFKQLVNIEYDDGARMTTIGGMLIGPDNIDNFERADFYDLEFTRKLGQDPKTIHIPQLTIKERNALEESLPENPVSNEVPVNDDYKRQYKKVYRYLPKFLETQI